MLALVIVRNEIALEPESQLHDPADGQDRGAEASVIGTQACEEVEYEIEEGVYGADEGCDGEIGYIPPVVECLDQRALLGKHERVEKADLPD